MPSNFHGVGIGRHDFSRPTETLVYRLGTNPATWPSLVVHSRAGDVGLHENLVPSAYTGISSLPQTIQDNLAKTLTEYSNTPTLDWSRRFLINAGGSKAPRNEYEYLRKDLANRLTAAEAKKVLEDPEERSIPWEKAKAELGR